MSNKPLKPGWKTVKFGDIAQNVAIRVDPAEAETDIYVGLEHLDPETLHLRSWGHPSDVTGQKLAFKKGDIIFGRRRAYQRKLAIAEFDGICSAHAMVLRAKSETILPEFLPFFLQSDMFMERVIEISVGSLSPTINWKTLRVQEFPLSPLEEQKRIAEILWAADEAIEAKQQLLSDLNGTRIGLGNSIWAKDHDLEMSTLQRLCVKIQDGTHFSPKTKEGPFKYITSKNIRNGFIDLSDTGRISKEEHDQIYKRADVKYGDIVLTKDGANTGNAAFFDLNEEVSLLSSVAFIRTDPKKINTKFLLAYLLSPQGQWKIVREMKGTAITRITLQQIKKFKVPLVNITMQNQLAEKFDGLVLTQKKCEMDLINLNYLKRKLTNELITGVNHV